MTTECFADRNFRPLLADLAKTSVAHCAVPERGSDGTFSCTVPSVSYFTILARDALQRPRNVGGERFEVRFEAPAGEKDEVITSIKDRGLGTYLVHFAIAFPGTYRVSILLAGVLGLQFLLVTDRTEQAQEWAAVYEVSH